LFLVLKLPIKDHRYARLMRSKNVTHAEHRQKNWMCNCHNACDQLKLRLTGAREDFVAGRQDNFSAQATLWKVRIIQHPIPTFGIGCFMKSVQEALRHCNDDRCQPTFSQSEQSSCFLLLELLLKRIELVFNLPQLVVCQGLLLLVVLYLLLDVLDRLLGILGAQLLVRFDINLIA